VSPTPYIYPHHDIHAATRHHAPLSSRQHHVSLSLSSRRSHPSPSLFLHSDGGSSSRGRNSQHLSYLLPLSPLIRSLGNSSNIPTIPLAPLPVILKLLADRSRKEELLILFLVCTEINLTSQRIIQLRANSIHRRRELMSRTKALDVRKDFSKVTQSFPELITVSKRQLSYWDTRDTRRTRYRRDLKVLPLIYFETVRKVCAIRVIGTKDQLHTIELLLQRATCTSKKKTYNDSPATTRVHATFKFIMPCKFISWPGRHLPVIRRRFEDVGQAGFDNICLFVVAGGDLSSSLLTRSAFRKRAPVLVSSSSHPRHVIPLLRHSRPFRMYFFSVNDVPRDNGTAGACRNRHHGGGKMAHNVLREAALVHW